MGAIVGLEVTSSVGVVDSSVGATVGDMVGELVGLRDGVPVTGSVVGAGVDSVGELIGFSVGWEVGTAVGDMVGALLSGSPVGVTSTGSIMRGCKPIGDKVPGGGSAEGEPPSGVGACGVTYVIRMRHVIHIALTKVPPILACPCRCREVSQNT